MKELVIRLAGLGKKAKVSEPRYLSGDEYAHDGVEGEEEIGDAGLPDRMWEDED